MTQATRKLREISNNNPTIAELISHAEASSGIEQALLAFFDARCQELNKSRALAEELGKYQNFVDSHRPRYKNYQGGFNTIFLAEELFNHQEFRQAIEALNTFTSVSLDQMEKFNVPEANKSPSVPNPVIADMIKLARNHPSLEKAMQDLVGTFAALRNTENYLESALIPKYTKGAITKIGDSEHTIQFPGDFVRGLINSATNNLAFLKGFSENRSSLIKQA